LRPGSPIPDHVVSRSTPPRTSRDHGSFVPSKHSANRRHPIFDDIQTDTYQDDTTGLLDPAFDELFDDTFSHIAAIDAAMDVITAGLEQ